RPAGEVSLDQRSPGATLRLGADRKAVAGKIDEHEAVVHQEEVELSRPSRRAAGARQAPAADETVQQRGLPHVRPPGERDLGRPRRWLPARRRRRPEERDSCYPGARAVLARSARGGAPVLPDPVGARSARASTFSLPLARSGRAVRGKAAHGSHPWARFSSGLARPRARFTARIWVAYVSRSAPFCSDSTMRGALSLLVCVNFR